MEPVTHMLTGACISRGLGFPARARYATAACVIAAELPDMDYVYRLGGPLTYFQHHRGWTHTLWALPLEALMVVAIFWVKHQTRSAWKKRRSKDRPAEARWFLLWLMALLALGSHLLLDWTNNYGIRPFAPFDTHWYAGELVFIVEPLIITLLSLALLLPLVFSFMHREPGIRRPKYAGRGLAAAALVFVCAIWAQRWLQHGDAETVMRGQELPGGPLLHVSLNPYPVNPYKWHVVAETPLNYQTGTVDTREGTFLSDPQQIYPKTVSTPTVVAARQSWLGRTYLDWSHWATVQDLGAAATVHPELTLSPAQGAEHVVRFSDLRFGYDVLGRGRASASRSLGAEVWVNNRLQATRAFLGTTEQRLPRQ